MNRKVPIRTYERKKVVDPITTLRPPILNNFTNNYISSNHGLSRNETTTSIDNSLDDPFDTTFDRIARNARVPLPPAEVHVDKSWHNCTNSSYNTSRNETINHKSLLCVSVNLSDINIKPVSKPRKVRKKSEMQVVKQTITRKTKATSQNNKKSLQKQNNVSLKIQAKVKKKEGHKTYRLHKARHKEKAESTTNSNTGASYLNSKTSCEDHDGHVAVIHKKRATKRRTLRSAKQKDEVSHSTGSFKDLKIKSCFVALNNVDLSKWKTSVKDVENSTQDSIQAEKMDNNSLAKNNTSCHEINKISNNNSEYNSAIDVKHCSVKIQRLEILEKKHGNIISSTPIGKPIRPSTYSIPLSPILIDYSKELNVPNICTDIISINLNDKDVTAIVPEKVNADSSQKCDVLETHTSKNEIESCSTYLMTKLNGYSLNELKKLNSKSESEFQVYSLSKEASMDLLTISNQIEDVNNEHKQLTHILVSSREYPSAMKSCAKNIENSSLDNILCPPRQKYTELDAVERKQLHVLNFSVDYDRSRSLFGDTGETAQTSIPQVFAINNVRGTEMSIDNLMNESSKSDRTTEVKNSKMCTDFIELSSNDSSTSTGDCKEAEEILIASTSGVKLKLCSDKIENQSNSIINMTNTETGKLDNKSHIANENNSVRIDKDCSTIGRCSVVLMRLQDPIRITNQRKRYRKWDLELGSISEDCNNEANSREKQPYPDKEKKKKETELHETESRLLQNVKAASMSAISDVPIATNNAISHLEKSVYLKPGKSWTRSLSILNSIKNESNLDQLSIGKGKKWRHSVKDVLDMQKQGVVHSCIGRKENDKEPRSSIRSSINKGRTFDSTNLGRLSRRVSIRVVPNNKSVKHIEDAPFLEAYGIIPVKSQTLINPKRSSVCNIQSDAVDNQIPDNHTAKEVVLQRCSQKDYMPFCEYFPESYLEHCRKIGEGVYGEVFLYEDDNQKSVIKIIPIEGSEYVNGEPQKKFHEILSEIVIAKELHNLRFNTKYNTNGFVEVKNIRCIVGKYPERLVELWNIYDEEKSSDNDCPSVFDENQLYIVLELGHGGQDLEAFVFHTAEEAHALFIQAALALAVAEKAVEFEHRDLHWGNVLISRTDEPYVHYELDQNEIEVPSKGVKVSIIDFTLSRVSYQGCSIFNDLASDPALFTAQGEYQFEIYRLMRDRIDNNWQKFEPYTNILWLHYTLDKMITAVRYKKKTLKVHKNALIKLEELKNEVLKYNSSFDFVTGSDKLRSMLCISSKSKTFTSVPKEQINIANTLFENSLHI